LGLGLGALLEADDLPGRELLAVELPDRVGRLRGGMTDIRGQRIRESVTRLMVFLSVY